MLHYWVFLLGYYLYVYMSYLERSMLSYFLRISIKICSVFMRAIGFLGGSGLFRTVMFQALDFLVFFKCYSLSWLTWALCTYSNNVAAYILNLCNCTDVLVIKSFTHSISLKYFVIYRSLLIEYTEIQKHTLISLR